MLDTLVSTKLHPSQARPKLVARPRLREKPERVSGRKLTLVSAPAGFGKTTLLNAWLESHAKGELSVAWVSLDEGDNDPARFLSYLVIALQSVEEGIGEGVLAALRSPEPPRIEALAGAPLFRADHDDRMGGHHRDQHGMGRVLGPPCDGASPLAARVRHLPKRTRPLMEARQGRRMAEHDAGPQAGMGVFVAPINWGLHNGFVPLFEWLPLLMVLMAFMGRMARVLQ
jgi:uncharacterized protein DUF6220